MPAQISAGLALAQPYCFGLGNVPVPAVVAMPVVLFHIHPRLVVARMVWLCLPLLHPIFVALVVVVVSPVQVRGIGLAMLHTEQLIRFPATLRKPSLPLQSTVVGLPGIRLLVRQLAISLPAL